MLLPLGVWARCSCEGGGPEDVRLEVGVVRGPGARHVATASYQQGRLQQVWLAQEVAA